MQTKYTIGIDAPLFFHKKDSVSRLYMAISEQQSVSLALGLLILPDSSQAMFHAEYFICIALT